MVYIVKGMRVRTQQMRVTRPVGIGDPLIQHKDLEFIQLIGNGGFGEVWYGRYLPTNQEVAIKKLRARELTQTIMSEIQIHARLRNRFVLRFIGYTNTLPFCIVTEYMPNGTLYDAIHSPDSQVEMRGTDKTMIAMSIAMGMEYIHSQGIIHQDFKSLNILLDKRFQPKICDFGISIMQNQNDDHKSKAVGTAFAMAPEQYRDEKITEAVDVYAYGIFLWELLTRKMPYEGRDGKQILYAVSMKGERPPIPDGTPEPLENLITRCWANDADDRPTFPEIVTEFVSQSVEFPGTVRTALENFLKSYVKVNSGIHRIGFRESSYRTRAEPKPSPLIVETPNDKSMPISAIIDTLTRKNNKDRMTRVFEVIKNSERVQTTLGPRMWELLLPLTVQCVREEYYETLIQLIEKLCRSQKNLDFLKSVENLHVYLVPATLNTFLYVVSFVPSVITPKIITELERFVVLSSVTDDHREKAVKLLCKIQANVTDQTVRSFIAKFMLNASNNALEAPYGHLMLKSVAMYAKNPGASERIIEIATKYLQSSVTENVAAGYQIIMYLAKDSTFVGLEDCLNHIVMDNQNLRDLAIEYLRKHFIDTHDISMVERIVNTAFITYEKYHCEKAAILMFHFASLPQFESIYTNRDFQTRFLNIADDAAADALQLFILMMRMSPSLIKHKSIPRYLTSILKYGDNQQFVVVCLLLTSDNADRDFLAVLDDAGVLGMICERLSNCERLDIINYGVKTLYRFIQIGYSESFRVVIPNLVSQLNHGTDAELCVVTLAMLCQFEQLVPDLKEAELLQRVVPFQKSQRLERYLGYMFAKLAK